MGGGKNEGEKVQTKKEMFRDLREKLNDAAQIPGFFDVGQKMVCEHIERHIESLSWKRSLRSVADTNPSS